MQEPIILYSQWLGGQSGTVLELVQLDVRSEWLNGQSFIGRRGLVQRSMVTGHRCSVLY